MRRLGWLALCGRIACLACEWVALRALGGEWDPVATCCAFYLVATAALAPALALASSDVSFWPAALAAGALYTAAFSLYVYAFSRGPVADLAPLTNLHLLLLVFLAHRAAAEPITPGRALGAALIVCGAGMLHGKGAVRGLFARRPAQALLASLLLLSLGRLLDKNAAEAHPALWALWINAQVAATQLAWLALRGRVREVVSLLRSRPRAAVVAGIANAGSYLGWVIAARSLGITVAEPLSALSSLLSLFLARQWLGEEVAGRLAPTLVMLAGAGLILLAS